MNFLCKILLIITCLLTLNLDATAGNRVNLDITAANLRRLPIAVPYFTDLDRALIQSHGREMADIVSRTLEFHGFIKVIDPKPYGGRQDTDWTRTESDFYVLGQYHRHKGKENILELRLFDNSSQRMILGRRYKGSWQQRRQFLNQYCDEVIETLSGTPGVSTSRIAFTNDVNGKKEIHIADILGDRVRQITKHNYLAVSPRLSPDGRKLAYTSYHRGNPNLYITDLKDARHTRAISRRPGLNMTPSWSPDGEKMVITLSRDGNPDLYLCKTNGTIIRRLTSKNGINVSPSFSPDGREITFVSDRSGSPQLYIMDINTIATRRLTYKGNENTTPSWSPDGKWIAYTSKDNGQYHIYKIKTDGSTNQRLTTLAGDHESPSWSPDSRLIVFSRKINNQTRLYTISHNGHALRLLFSMEGNQSSPQWSSR